MYIDAWWFENKQSSEQILQPDWFTPRTHFSVLMENENICLPLKLSVRAMSGNNIVFQREYCLTVLTDSENYEIVTKEKSLLFKGFADNVSGLPDKIIVAVSAKEGYFQKEIFVSYFCVSGRITDFEGNPFPAPVIFQKKFFGGKTPSIGAWSDSDGKYSVVIPGGLYESFYVDDDSYKISTLENWSWNMLVDGDEIHDFKIGNAEVYDLSVSVNADNAERLRLSFRPMVLPQIRFEKTETILDGEKVFLWNNQPDIDKSDLRITVDGKSVEILSLEKYYSFFRRKKDKIAMICYFADIKKPEFSKNKALIVLEYITNSEYKTQSQGRTYIYK